MRFLQRGFTLVELLVVISIIGILVSVVAVNSNIARRQSRDARRKADLQNVAGALELYRATNRRYPMGTYADLKAALQPFTTDVPTDPSTNANGSYGGFFYFYYSDGQRFVLDARLENKSEAPTINPAPQNGAQPSGPNDAAFYSTGIYHTTSGDVHYRVSGP